MVMNNELREKKNEGSTVCKSVDTTKDDLVTKYQKFCNSQDSTYSIEIYDLVNKNSVVVNVSVDLNNR